MFVVSSGIRLTPSRRNRSTSSLNIGPGVGVLEIDCQASICSFFWNVSYTPYANTAVFPRYEDRLIRGEFFPVLEIFGGFLPSIHFMFSGCALHYSDTVSSQLAMTFVRMCCGNYLALHFLSSGLFGLVYCMDYPSKASFFSSLTSVGPSYCLLNLRSFGCGHSLTFAGKTPRTVSSRS